MKRTILALALLAFSMGSRAQDSTVPPKVGDRAASGNLIIHIFKSSKGDKDLPAELKTQYGVMMYRNEKDGARFVLADRAKNSVNAFRDYDEFLEALSALPKSSTVSIYDRCLVGLFSDFYPVEHELFKKFSRDCRRRGVKIAKRPVLTCTCTE